MTFDENLAKTQQEAIPELYEFNYAGIYDRYTSFPEDITFQGVEFKRATIKRTGFSMDTEFGKVSVSIQTPLVPTLRTYIANQPVEQTTVTIYRAVYGSLDQYRILFKGDVLRVSFKGSMCQASCEMQSHILSQRIPNIVHQAYCNHQVFDSGCGLDESAWWEEAVITGIVSDKYTSFVFGSHDDGYYIGGQLIKGNDARLIINHIGNDVWLHVPFDSRVGIGTAVLALPGCDGKASTCRDKFNNFSNHLAMPYIPDTNPVIWGFK